MDTESSSIDQAKHEEMREKQPPDGAKKLQRSQTEESTHYPSGTKLGLIMVSLYLAMFCVALVSYSPSAISILPSYHSPTSPGTAAYFPPGPFSQRPISRTTSKAWKLQETRVVTISHCVLLVIRIEARNSSELGHHVTWSDEFITSLPLLSFHGHTTY
jgi:hypothetical protein